MPVRAPAAVGQLYLPVERDLRKSRFRHLGERPGLEVLPAKWKFRRLQADKTDLSAVCKNKRVAEYKHSIERIVEHLALQRREFERNQGRLFCFGFIKHFWKQNYVRAYTRGLGIFELPEYLAWPDWEQWEPLTKWLRSVRSQP